MKQLNVLGARRQFYRSGGSATRRLRELMPTADDMRISADSVRSSADFVAHQHNFAFYPPGTSAVRYNYRRLTRIIV